MVDYPFVTGPTNFTFKFDGPFPVGTQLTLSWDRAQAVTPCGPFPYAANWYADGETLLGFRQFPDFVNPYSFSTTLQLPAAFIQGSFWTSSYCSGGTVFNLRMVSTGGPGFCQYGTERNPASPLSVYVDNSLLNSWLSPKGWIWLAAYLVSQIGGTIFLDELCSQPPPVVPQLPSDPLQISASQARDLLLFVAWYANCRCKSGTPPPVEYPTPPLTQPPGQPVPPTFPCLNADVCASITRIEQAVFAMRQTLGQNYELVTLLQRYGLPFANINGARHSGVTGAAAFAISRLVGMRVEITDLVGEHRRLEGTPEYVWDLGWMSIGDEDGMWQEQRITRLNQQWFPQPMPMATTFGYFLKDGVTAAFQEIQAEP